MDKVQIINAFKFMVSFAWKHKKSYLFLLIVEQLLYLALGLLNTFFPGWILNAVFETKDLKTILFMVLVFASLLWMIKTCAQYIRTQIYNSSYVLSMKFSMYIGETTSKLDFKYIEDESVLNLHDKAINCVYNDGFFGPLERIISLIGQVLMLASVSVILVRLNPFIIILCIITIALNFTVNYVVNKKMYELDSQKTKINRKKRYLLNVFDDFEYGKEIRINCISNYLKIRLKDTFSDIYELNRKSENIQYKNSIFENTTSAIQKVGIYVLLAIEVLKKGLGVGDFTLYFNAINQFSGSINSLLKGYLSLSKMGLYMDDLKKFVSLPRMDDDISKDKVNEEDELYFEFVNVSFKYPGTETYALKNINLKITSGDRLAIVGANGAGKTTLVKLLLRLYNPSEGVILLGGKDIREFKYEEYAKLFSVVFQDYKLFAFSIEENIGLSESIDKGKLNDSIEKSGLRKKINELPLKEKTPLFRSYDDGGVELSGGEAQKLGIARSLYKDSKVVILDEPTAALDPIAEYEIYQHFNMLVEGRTSIYISHRLASTRFSNNIIVLDKGEIVESGNHMVLMKKNGLYSEMYNMQAEYYNNYAQEV